MFDSFGQEARVVRGKEIHLILNGKPDQLFSHHFNKTITRQQIAAQCGHHWDIVRGKSLRFFTPQGVQLLEQDLAYVRNGQRVYVSRGQDFDSSRNFGEYKLIEPLGEGGFGKVWLGRSCISQEEVAIKVLKINKITGARDIDMLFRQIENLKALSHPHIVKILNCFTLPNMQIVVVMEYLKGGELLALLKEKGVFSELEAHTIFGQIIAAVEYCHLHNIVHRDLKLENVLFSDRDRLRVKIADFGISGVADRFNPDLDIGTLRYMAPEVLSRQQKINTGGVDVWACGVMLFFMVFGQMPFREATNSLTRQAIVSGNFTFPSQPQVSNECKELISYMLQVNPKTRPNMSDVLAHSWVLFPPDFTQELTKQTSCMTVDRQESPQRLIRLPNLKKSCHGRLEKKLQKQQVRKEEIVGLRRTKLGSMVPKRFERDRAMQDAKNLSKGRLPSRHNGSVDLLYPRYMQPIKCKEEQGRQLKRKRTSLIHNLWK